LGGGICRPYHPLQLHHDQLSAICRTYQKQANARPYNTTAMAAGATGPTDVHKLPGPPAAQHEQDTDMETTERKVMYHILKVTISRRVEDMPFQQYSYLTDVFVQDIKQERERLKSQFQADRVHLCYETIDKDEK